VVQCDKTCNAYVYDYLRYSRCIYVRKPTSKQLHRSSRITQDSLAANEPKYTSGDTARTLKNNCLLSKSNIHHDGHEYDKKFAPEF